MLSLLQKRESKQYPELVMALSTTGNGKRRSVEGADENQNPNVPVKRIREGEEKTEIIQQFQSLLRTYENDEKLVITKAEEKSGSEPGQNYLSIVVRTRVSGKRGDGNKYEKSFIRKLPVGNEESKRDTRSDELFQIEIHMYKNLLALWGCVGPRCVFSEPKQIILEDLGQRHFKLCGKRSFFDLDHCLVVVQMLASMHAKSLGLKLKDPATFARLIAPLKENVFPADGGPSMSHHFEAGIGATLAALRAIESRDDARAQSAIEFLSEYEGKVVATMRRLLSPKSDEDSRYWVVTHGDVYKNNLMFSYNGEGKIVNVKFVDFQVARHSSAALDFTYLLYTSAGDEVIEHKFDHIVAEYERFFVHGLRLCNVPDSDLVVFSRPGWFKRELQRYGLFGFLSALTTVHAIFMDEESAVLYEKNKTGAVEIPSGVQEIPKEKKERILFLTDHYVKHFRKDL